mmetsp:Transcript_16694/g.42620  ORF Transcript_16694/g.42620 Transcript_16694/m.42620 type:complete len:236 (-) Transcript_16694:109-816(-)
MEQRPDRRSARRISRSRPRARASAPRRADARRACGARDRRAHGSHRRRLALLPRRRACEPPALSRGLEPRGRGVVARRRADAGQRAHGCRFTDLVAQALVLSAGRGAAGQCVCRARSRAQRHRLRTDRGGTHAPAVRRKRRVRWSRVARRHGHVTHVRRTRRAAAHRRRHGGGFRVLAPARVGRGRLVVRGGDMRSAALRTAAGHARRGSGAPSLGKRGGSRRCASRRRSLAGHR